MQRTLRFVENRNYLLFLVVLVAILASVQSYYGSMKTFVEGGLLYTNYNNYVIFRQSFYHLIQKNDLYQLYEAEQWDLYKYSPAFALLFGMFAWMPDLPGLTLWNLLNSLVLFFAIYYLPDVDNRKKGLIILFVLVELITSLQNEQSNGLMAGLIIFAFGLLEKRHYWLASFCLVASVYIKLFGLVGLSLYLLYPDKLKLTYTTALWVVLFTLLPLLVVDLPQFVFLYKSWGNLLANDHSISDGLSVIGWLKTWFGRAPDKTLVSLGGMLLFCLPLLRFRNYSAYGFRLLLLASVLVWVVIFNHRAESPTFVIAVSGVALWYVAGSPKTENLVLLVLTLLFTVLSATDLFPAPVRNEWFKPYVVKAVPCILVWAKIIFDLLTHSKEPAMHPDNQRVATPVLEQPRG